MTNKILKYSNIIALALSIIAIIFTAYGLVQSERSNDIAKNAYQLASLQYEEGKKLILKADFSEKRKVVRFKPVEEGFNVQYLNFQFPVRFNDVVKEAFQPNFQLSTFVLSNEIIDYANNESGFRERVGKDQAGILMGALPVIVRANFTIKGQVRETSGLYLIHYRVFLASNELNIKSNISYNGFSMVAELKSGVNEDKILENYWLGNQN
ncbi:hypothetical protein [Aliivibrio fischeri]|uniref:hypothetical protein n=1 Tax=Aliivibrio fischeri TaxID=668 RepID=UPI00084C4724|nr:hypothetical protein [Aliivibrio fischeri]OED51055.1 hypothetical protein BEI47_10445 [Aliivibrio fischeri]